MTGCSAWSELRKLNGVGDIVVKNWLLLKLNWKFETPKKKKEKRKVKYIGITKLMGHYGITSLSKLNLIKS